MDINLNKFGYELGKEIILYSFINQIPITSLAWEERVYNALIYSDVDNKDIIWIPGSHKSGKDIDVYNKYAFSCKSMVAYRGIASLSSFRTTSFNTLEDKINFIDNKGKNFTHYLIIARTYTKNYLKYIAYMIDANYILASKYEWEETFGKKKKNLGKFTGWQTTQYTDGIKLKIIRSMSDQFWIYMDTNNFYENENVKILSEVSIEKKYIGKYWKFHRDGVLNARK